ncbi:MAG: hypothetical protein IPN36_14800 [Bacteroidetes bacterium]|nr:hypothetical protein [Bacteroidota bacterium]
MKRWILNFSPFSNGSYGKPIKFALKYINTDDICSISYSTKIASKTCTKKPPSDYRYDVKLKLVKMEAVKVDEGFGGDDTEDLFGRIYVSKSVVGSSKLETKFSAPNPTKPGSMGEVNYAHSFFHYKESSPFKIRKGSVSINDSDGEKILATNQSYDAVKKMQLAIGYSLKDKEINTPVYKCHGCNDEDERVPTPLGAAQLSSINSATPNEWNALKFGEDKYFEMNFYEDGKNREGSHIRAWFQLQVRPK